jgi:tetratricopeptide (TPR) repeat protein
MTMALLSPGLCRSVFCFTLLGLMWLAGPAFLFADDATPDIESANRAFTYGNYDESAQLFQKIIAARGYSASLCFNLANAEAKAGHPGLAMLNYERARYLAPGDADIDHNLQLARQQAGLKPNTYRWWQIVMRSINWTVWLALIVSGLTLLLVALIGTSFATAIASGLKIPLPALRTTFRAIFFIFIPLTLIFGFVELACIGFNNRIEGVIVASKTANLYLSPFEGAENIGSIPEGELVTVEDRHNDYLRIEGRDHHFGWIQQKDIEPVVAGSFDAPASQ